MSLSDLFDRIALLKRTPILSEVLTEDLRVVAAILEEQACFAGERIFDIDTPSDKAFIIQSGRIGISVQEDAASREFVAVLGPGECFGEMGIFDDQPRSATAHALEDGILLALDKAKLRGLIASYPELALGMLRTLSLRLRDANVKHRK
jgi:CRP/FNR family cyclic AMP-dependent transcriptional regulator